MAKYVSGRQKNLKVGISSYSENLTSLEVIGNVGIATTNATSRLYVVGDGYFTGVVTATAFYGTFSGNAATATYATSAGIATYATNAGIATYATNAGIATYATNAGIATYATNAGIATYATNAGIATYATNAGIATYADNAGIATYATSAGIATYATSAGIATYATSAGIATYATNAGIATYATNAGIATYATSAGIATYATNAGISTNVIGGIASVTQLQVTGVSTFTNGPVLVGTTTATGTASQRLQVDGGAYFSGIGASVGIGTTNPQFKLDVNGDINFNGTFYQNGSQFVASRWDSGTGDNIYRLNGNVGVGTTNPTVPLSVIGNANFTGVVTASSFSGNASSATYATNAGIATYATNAGIATYATNAGIATNLKGGAIGNIPYQSGSDTTVFLTNGGSGTILQSNGPGATPSWVSAAPSGAITGITIRDEGDLVGVEGSVTQLDFVGSNISVASTSGIATITVSNNLVGTALSITGISTFSNGPVFIGAATSTGTASQPLQVTGGAYVSDNLGIGTANPTSKLYVVGDGYFTGVVTATSFSGFGTNLTGIVTSIVAGTNITVSDSTGQVTINAAGGLDILEVMLFA